MKAHHDPNILLQTHVYKILLPSILAINHGKFNYIHMQYSGQQLFKSQHNKISRQKYQPAKVSL